MMTFTPDTGAMKAARELPSLAWLDDAAPPPDIAPPPSALRECAASAALAVAVFATWTLCMWITSGAQP